MALRNEPWREEDGRTRAPKPPTQRRIIRRRTYPPIPLVDGRGCAANCSTWMCDFALFSHARTDEDVVVHRLVKR